MYVSLAKSLISGHGYIDIWDPAHMRHTQWIWLPMAAVSSSVYATTYLTVEQAQQAIFPGASFTQAFVTLSDEQQRDIECTHRRR